MAGVFISGFSGTSSGAVPGTQAMASEPTIGRAIVGGSSTFTHTQVSAAADAIVASLRANPNQPVVVVGHSFGGDSAIELCEELAKRNICVDLLVQVDSVGVGDEVKPTNVRRGVNIYSTSGEGINGATTVSGSENIGVAGTSHTNIDDNPATNPNVGAVPAGAPFAGLNAWQIIAQLIASIPGPPWCNSKGQIKTALLGLIPGTAEADLKLILGTVESDVAPITGSTVTRLDTGKSVILKFDTAFNQSDGARLEIGRSLVLTSLRAAALGNRTQISLSELQEVTRVEAQYLRDPIVSLIRSQDIYQVVGVTPEPWFSLQIPEQLMPDSCQKRDNRGNERS